MSLRAEQTATCFRPTHARTLEHVLRIGTPETSASELATTVEVAGLTISTDPNVWTGLTLSEVVKLKLKPYNPSDFNYKSRVAPNDPNSGYYRTMFLSDLYPRPPYDFWVEHLGYRKAEQIVYYVLARPRSDTKTYVRGQV